MKILAIEKEIPGTAAGQFTEELKQAEAARVWALYQGEIVREMYFRADRREAVLVLECAGVEEAHTQLGTLPLVRAGLIDFELIPLAPYPGFERLFKDKEPV